MATAPTASVGTRERVIAATIVLMRRSGYAGFGINEILAEGGAPKGSLYHFFPDGKRQIISEALEAYTADILALYERELAKPGTPGQKVKRLLKLPARRLQESGYQLSCPGGTVSLDLNDELEPVRATVERYFQSMVDLFTRHLGFAERRRAESFADLLLSVIEGAYIRGRAEHSTRAFAQAAHWLAELADRAARA